ncbi:cytochrome c oxidase assembly protein COX19 isoform X1 [Desmodus rotundus]|uniref:cytochrome c oxidase assembly protein COX19 isoform X1 n=1 Tax=Desmodus rotundus TaxID=9430 RepID=UPI0023816699|nr:uncharacterized protein LOC112319664 [Desmodus rotundus]
MSTAMNFGTKSFQPRPPDKGSFPLDHFGECTRFKEKFLKCLRENNFENGLCRYESKEYLECRMERQVPLTAPRPGSPRPQSPPGRFFPEALGLHSAPGPAAGSTGPFAGGLALPGASFPPAWGAGGAVIRVQSPKRADRAMNGRVAAGTTHTCTVRFVSRPVP